jgi:autotransporter-associated beta strand protein
MKPKNSTLVFGSLAIVLATSASAQSSYTWDTSASGNTGSWGTAANWTADGIPTANDTANFTTAGSPATIALDGNRQIKVLSFNNANTTWTLNEGSLSGAKLNITDGDGTANEGNGVSATVSNTTLNLNVGLGSFSGSASSDEAVFTGTNSTVNLTKAFTQRLTFGTTNTVGSVAMTINLDAANVVSGRLSVGFRDNVSQAPSNNVASTFLRVNQSQTSSIDQIRVAGGSGSQAGVMTLRNDATWTQNGGFIAVGYATSNGANGKSTGRLEIGEVGSAGNLTLNSTALLSLGNSAGTGILNVNNGTLTVQANTDTAVVTLGDAPGTFVAANGAGHGTLNLNIGGTLVTQRQFARNATAHDASVGSGTFNFDGGLLRIDRATGNVTTDLFGTGVVVNVQNGGARIDTQANNSAFDEALNGVGNGGLEKLGAGMLTLNGTNTYNGNTVVTAGTLKLGSAGSVSSSSNYIVNGTLDVSAITPSTFSVATGKKLSGTGTVNATGKTLSIEGTHAVGNSVGQQDIVGTTSYAAGSIFEWELGSNVETGRGTNFYAVDINGTLNIDGTATTGAVFRIILGTAFNGDNAFWQVNRSWDVFNATSSSTAFTNFQLYNSGDLVNQVPYNTFGSFSYGFTDGTGTLSWTTVPEPTSALAGLLLSAGLLRRRRAH